MTIQKSSNMGFFTNLWFLVSLIPFLNGFGIVYIGSKTLNKPLQTIGFYYELPWILLLISACFGVRSLAILSGIAGIILMFVSIIHSLTIIRKYPKIRRTEVYRKSNSKLKSLIGLCICCIPYISGLTPIYIGSKYDYKYLKILGLISEIFWVLGLISNTLMVMAFVLQLLLINEFIKLNYKSNIFSHDNKTLIESPYEKYKNKIDELTSKFDLIEKSMRNHIEDENLIENYHEDFYKQKSTIISIINTTKEASEDVENEIKERIKSMESTIKDMTTLKNNLQLNEKMIEMDDLNYCIYCGYKLDHSEKYCPNCGRELIETPEEPPKEPIELYKFKIKTIEKEYGIKEEEILDLIKKRFDSNELTYTRFVEQLNRNHELFYKKVDNGMDILNIIDELTKKIESELDEILEVLEKMLKQLKELIEEFLINKNNQEDIEIDGLLEDMNNLIKSVKNYK